MRRDRVPPIFYYLIYNDSDPSNKVAAAAQNRNCSITIIDMTQSEFEIKKVKNAAKVFLTVKRPPPHIAGQTSVQSIPILTLQGWDHETES